jgi:hypothetical protein
LHRLFLLSDLEKKMKNSTGSFEIRSFVFFEDYI